MNFGGDTTQHYSRMDRFKEREAWTRRGCAERLAVVTAPRLRAVVTASLGVTFRALAAH